MASEGVYIKRHGALVPADPEAWDILSKVGEGKMVLVGVRAVRSPKQNAFVHALLHEVVQHTDRFKDIDDLKDFLKMRSKMFRLRILPDGSTVLDLQKTSFGSMDQIQFARVWDRWKWIIVNEILPDLDDRALRERILEQIS